MYSFRKVKLLHLNESNVRAVRFSFLSLIQETAGPEGMKGVVNGQWSQ